MKKNIIIQNDEIFPDTHFFIYKNKQFPIKFAFFKYSSDFFANNQEEILREKYIRLLDEETERRLNFSEDAIQNFINYVQGQKVLLNNENVTILNYLAKKYQVFKLVELTSKYISDNNLDLALDVVLTYEEDQSFETSVYENAISSNFTKYLNDDRLLTLKFPTLYRIISKYQEEQEKTKQLTKEMSIFLFKCLDKYGQEASILFSKYEFEIHSEILNRLLNNYSTKFDFHFINHAQVKKLYDTQNENIRKTIEIENKFMNEMEKMKNYFNNQLLMQSKEIQQLKNEVKKVKSLESQNKNLEIEVNHLKEKVINLETLLLSKDNSKDSLNDSLYCSLFNSLDNVTQLSFLNELKIRNNTESIIHFTNFISYLSEQINDQNQKNNFIQIKQRVNNDDQKFNEIFIPSKITELLHQSQVLTKPEFTNNLLHFNNICIEIKYPSSYFDDIYQIVLNIKNLHHKSLKIGIFVSEIEETDRIFYENNINYVNLDHTVEKIIIPNINDSSKKCSSIEQISIPPSVILINNSAFAYFSSLTEVDIPSSVTSIGKYAFRGCYSLKKVSIASSVTSIGEYAFSGCRRLFQLTIDPFNTKINSYSFICCKSLDILIINTTSSSIKPFKYDIFGKITQIIILPPVKSIESRSFYSNLTLSKIIIPSSVTLIGDSAFYGCSKLTEILIPSSVNQFGSMIFNECRSLQKITFPNSFTKIADAELNNLSLQKNISFVYSQGHELNGIIKYLTNKTGGNINDNGTICVTASSFQFSGYYPTNPKNLVDYTKLSSKYMWSANNEKNATVLFDFKSRKVKLTNYTLHTPVDDSMDYPRSWIIECSNNAFNWLTIDHRNDESIMNSNNVCHTFYCQRQLDEYYQYIRIKVTDFCWNKRPNRYYFDTAAVEFFGILQENK